MKKYEYKIFSPKMKGFRKKTPKGNIEEELNALGAEGWEVIAVLPLTANMGTSYGGTTSGIVYYLKREQS